MLFKKLNKINCAVKKNKSTMSMSQEMKSYKKHEIYKPKTSVVTNPTQRIITFLFSLKTCAGRLKYFAKLSPNKNSQTQSSKKKNCVPFNTFSLGGCS